MTERLQTAFPFRVDVPRARKADPQTSHDAAASITAQKLSESQEYVMRALEELIMGTDSQILERMRRLGYAGSESRARTARKELKDKSRVYDTLLRREVNGHGLSVVWGLVKR